jgi:L-lactate dehydrogenase complex protein LldF
MLCCVRCGACLNVCPVYSRTGGHAYDSVYPGPIGAILTPQLVGIERAASLPFASSLCGACYEACPVKIDIPAVLLHLRAQAVEAKRSRLERAAMSLAAWSFASARRLALAQRVARVVQRPLVRAGLLAPWSRSRDLRPVARERFRDWWRRERP